MPAKRLSMRKIRDVLRLSWGCQQSQRQVALQCNISRPCVSEYLRRASEAELYWPLPEDLSDAQPDLLLFPPPPKLPAEQRGMPDWAVVYEELQKKNVTIFLLWQEYRARHPNGYNYSWRPKAGIASFVKPYAVFTTFSKCQILATIFQPVCPLTKLR